MTQQEIKAVEDAAKTSLNILKYNDGDFVAWDSEGDFGDEIDHCVAIQRGNKGWFSVIDKLQLDIYAILNPDNITFVHSSVTGFPFNYRLATDSEIQQLLDGIKEKGKVWNAELKCIDELRKPSEPDKELLAALKALAYKFDYSSQVIYSHAKIEIDKAMALISKYESK